MVLTVAVLCWGLAPVATRYLLTTNIPALSLLILRFLVSSVVFVPLVILRSKGVQWNEALLWQICFCGVLSIIGYNTIVTFGIQLIPAEMAGLLLATEPLWIVLLSSLILRETLRWPMIAGLVIAGVGILFLLVEQC